MWRVSGPCCVGCMAACCVGVSMPGARQGLTCLIGVRLTEGEGCCASGPAASIHLVDTNPCGVWQALRGRHCREPRSDPPYVSPRPLHPRNFLPSSHSQQENMKGLLGYVVESPRWPELQALDFAPTFRRLSMKHDQNQVVCRLRQEVLCTWAACPIPGCGWALSLGHCSKKLTFVTSHQQERSTGSAAAPAGSGPGSEAGGGVFLGHARAAAAAQQRRIREWGQGEGEGER